MSDLEISMNTNQDTNLGEQSMVPLPDNSDEQDAVPLSDNPAKQAANPVPQSETDPDLADLQMQKKKAQLQLDIAELSSRTERSKIYAREYIEKHNLDMREYYISSANTNILHITGTAVFVSLGAACLAYISNKIMSI